VTGAPRHPPRGGRNVDDVRREPAFLRGNRRRMHYADATAGHAIGSGSVEGANRMPVTARTRRSGQGRGAPAFRALPGSGRLHRAWAELVPRLSRSGGWKPPECANENGPVARIVRRVIRERNVRGPKGEPYENRTP